MKKLYFIGMLSVLALCFTGCNGQGQNQPESITGNVSQPVWTVSDTTDMTMSMTAVIKVDLATRYPASAADFALNANDLLGAFAGEKCLGKASPQDGLFFLYVDGTEGAVTLRYYSAQYKNLFEAKDAFPFVNDSHLGTVAEPFTPAFTVVQ